MEQLVSTFDIIGFILAIVSVILAIVSIVFSAIFFWWGKEQNDSVTLMSVRIDEKVAFLEKLFDKMYDSTYQIVRENNLAMQRKLFQGGSFESQNLENIDMDVTLHVMSKKRVSISDICNKYNISKEKANLIVKKLLDRGTVRVEPDNEMVVALEAEVSTADSSDDDSNVGNLETA